MGRKNLLGPLHLLRKYLSLRHTIFHCLSIFFLSETFASITTFNEVLQSQKWPQHSSKQWGEENASNLAYHMHTHTRKCLPSHHLIQLFCFFNVCKPSLISVPCIMAQRWYHQRKASLTKWERQIDCSIRREGPLSGNLIGSH